MTELQGSPPRAEERRTPSFAPSFFMAGSIMAMLLLWLGFALVFFGVGAWLAASAAIAAGIFELTGSVFLGIGSVALANLAGVGIVLYAMRNCWRDIGLPRTRRMLQRVGPAPT